VPTRRSLLAAAILPAATALHRPAASPVSFSAFLSGVRAEARSHGIAQHTLDQALTGLQPNPKVIELDRSQPEFTLTWQQYRARIVSDARIARGRQFYSQSRPLLAQVSQRYGVPASVIMGIWGLESNFGQSTGGFNVIDALATLSWEGRRAAFFRSELMDALRILDHGDIAAAQMTGSYAGAMGQTQFMPDSFLKYAVDWRGTGRRDIWGDLGCVFASTANYLAREGWQSDRSWGDQVAAPAGLSPYDVGREHLLPIEEWVRRGVRRTDNAPLRAGAGTAALVLPGGAGDDAFLVYHPNFRAIRRYNPSDFYCISVGLLGDRITA